MKKTLELDFSNKASNVSITGDVVSKVWGQGLGWTEHEARTVLRDHSQYLENLASVGVRTSQIVGSSVIQDETGNFVIAETEQFCGDDTSVKLLGSNDVEVLREHVRSDFGSIAALLLSIPPRRRGRYSEANPWFSVPVDMKPQNVVIDSLSNEPVVVDTFGPKLWQGDTIKPLPTRVPGKGQVLHDEIKVGDVRFSVGRLNGYYIALATRWLINQVQQTSIEEVDALRADIATITREIIEQTVQDSSLFEQQYAQTLVSDAAEQELVSIRLGTFEGPRYVQALYEQEHTV